MIAFCVHTLNPPGSGSGNPTMAKTSKNRRRTDDKHIEGVKRIDAPPEEIAQALFHDNRKPPRKMPRPTRR